jgi:arylsulfatase A-like enzyme
MENIIKQIKIRLAYIFTATVLLFITGNTLKSQNTINYKIVDTGVDDFYNNSGVIAAPSSGEPFYGQDATYKLNTPSYTNNNNGTITDNVTGLIWQQDMGEKITFADAATKADTMTLGGHNDWRVPTIKELYSLILFSGETVTEDGTGTFNPYIDLNYFIQPIGDLNAGERTIDAQTWSSTEYVGQTMNSDKTVFGVNFVDGRIKGYPKYKPGSQTGNTMYFRMVRGNTAYGQNNFIDNADGTISDIATGLMWQKADDGQGKDWQDALSYAEGLELADYSDWRLPNAKELQSIVDYTRAPDITNSPAIDPKFETTEINDPEGNPGQYPYFWTSSTHLDGRVHGESAIYIAFGEAQGEMNSTLMDVHGAGAQRSDPKTGNASDYPVYFGPQGDVRYVFNHVRCVRTIPQEDLSSARKNILLIISDDVGIDYSSGYNSPLTLPPTPNIDNLAEEGVLFSNAWAAPLCSPTRATILSGQYGFNTGVTAPVGGITKPGLSTDTYTLPQALDELSGSGYATACIGKWHLGTNQNGGNDNPNNVGFSYYSGNPDGFLEDYYSWEKIVNGTKVGTITTYATTENVNDAISWIGDQEKPWLMWLAFNAGHAPFHLPPATLHSYSSLPFTKDATENMPEYYSASLEAMDTEIGRLINWLKSTEQYENTNIIYIGDNGTPAKATQEPYIKNQSKGTLYEGGVHVPLTISGPAVNNPGRTTDALTSSVDLFSTILSLAGIDPQNELEEDIDSETLIGVLKGTGDDSGITVRNADYHLIIFEDESEEFYNVTNDRYEEHNLLSGSLSSEEQTNYDLLKNTITSLLNGEDDSDSNDDDDTPTSLDPFEQKPDNSIEVIRTGYKYFEVSTDYKFNKGTLTVIDIYGKTLYSQIIDNTNCQLNLSNFSTGVYIVSITKNHSRQSQKILVH